MNKYKRISVILFIFLIIGGLLSCLVRNFPDFDFYSYHYYNAYGFLNDRIDTDFMVSSFRSYFNPLTDIINYILLKKLEFHPYLFLFISGMKLGIFFFLSYLLYNFIFKGKGKDKTVMVMSSLLFLFFSPVLYKTLGFEWNDLQISSFILLSALLYFKNIFTPETNKKYIWILSSGLLIGLAVGLKYSSFIYGFSIILCMIFSYKRINHFYKTLFLFISGMTLGFFITDGFWLYKVYSRFLNPMFPYFNNFFHSPFGTQSLVLDYDFGHLRPTSLYSILFLPFANSIKENTGAEFSFFDLKIPLSFAFTVIYLFLRTNSFRFKKYLNKITDIKITDGLFIFIISSYYLNTVFFGQVRYICTTIAFLSFLPVIFSYIYALYINGKVKPNIYKLTAFAVIMGIIHIFSAKFYSLEIFAVGIYIFAIFALFYICFSKRTKEFSKLFYSYILIFVFCFIGLTRIPEILSAKTINIKNVISVKDINVEKDSIVFLATMSSGFIAPHINPDVKFLGYAMEEEDIMKKTLVPDWRYSSLLDYTSPYMRKKTSDILNGNYDIYMIFGHQDIFFALDEMKEIYQNSVRKYTNNEIDDIYKDCKSIPYVIMSSDNQVFDYEICKIKSKI